MKTAVTATDTISVHGYDLDLRRIYTTMWDQSSIDQGEQVYNGLRSDTTAMKWLLAELFNIPVTPTYNKVYGDARREVTIEFDKRGWATKVDKNNNPALHGTKSRTSRYVLHHAPKDLT